MKILSIEQGLINDDFLHQRITLRIHIEESAFYAVKMYSDGRLMNYSDDRLNGGEYIEFPILGDFEQEIKSRL